MATNIATAAPSAALIPAAVQAAGGKEDTDEEVRQLVASLEEPFDPQEIRWRVTNTTKDRACGQVAAYADPRAYTDRLNNIFTVCGWTRKYMVEMINKAAGIPARAGVTTAEPRSATITILAAMWSGVRSAVSRRSAASTWWARRCSLH